VPQQKKASCKRERLPPIVNLPPKSSIIAGLVLLGKPSAQRLEVGPVIEKKRESTALLFYLVKMKNLFVLLFWMSALAVQAQQQYVTKKDIPYYADSINRKDAEIAARCKLDIYYPKGGKNFRQSCGFTEPALQGETRKYQRP
jgi:hypothetical protein